MPKKKSSRPRPGTVEHFNEFLAAADRVALHLMLEEGLLVDQRSDDGPIYESALNDLARRFVGRFESSRVDDHCTYSEHWAKVNTAHMIGLALGLRLQRSALGLGKGGAQ